MALTITQYPAYLIPAYNDQFITALSGAYATSGFKYIVTVEVNSSGVLHTFNVLPRPDGYMVINIKETVKNYINHYFNPELSLTNPCELTGNKSVSVAVHVYEYYSGANHLSYNFSYTAFDGCLKESDYLNYDYSKFLTDTANPFHSLTTDKVRPDKNYLLGQDLWLHFNKYNVDNIKLRLIRGGSQVDIITVNPIPTSSILLQTYVLRVNSNAFPVGAAVGDIINIQFLLSTSIIVTMDVPIILKTTDHKDYILYYLDRTGNILYFHFDLLSEENVSKSTGTVRLSSNKLTSGVYSSKYYDRQNFTTVTSSVSAIKLNTNWITESQSEALEELFDSPQVYLYLNGIYTPVIVTDSSYKKHKLMNEPLYNYSLTVELDKLETRQRGI